MIKIIIKNRDITFYETGFYYTKIVLFNTIKCYATAFNGCLLIYFKYYFLNDLIL